MKIQYGKKIKYIISLVILGCMIAVGTHFKDKNHQLLLDESIEEHIYTPDTQYISLLGAPKSNLETLPSNHTKLDGGGILTLEEPQTVTPSEQETDPATDTIANDELHDLTTDSPLDEVINEKEILNTSEQPSDLENSTEVTNEPPNYKELSKDGIVLKGEYFKLSYMSKILTAPDEEQIKMPIDEFVYYHTMKQNHYLIERLTRQGDLVRELQIGELVYVGGRTYQVQEIKRMIPNDGTATELLFEYDNRPYENITFNTCDTGLNNSPLGFWMAVPID